jgi:nitroreductase
MLKTTERPLSALDVIFTRRSVRAYTGAKLDRSTVRSLLDAAVQAPTAMHAEPWLFVVIQDDGILKRYSDLARSACLEDLESRAAVHHRSHADEVRMLAELRDPSFSMFFDAGTLIVIYGRAKEPFVVADCWLAAENLMLAACALGLGACVIGAAVSTFNSPEALKAFGVPAGAFAVAPVVVGVPGAAAVEPRRRRDPEIICWK